ncbi:MAG TPA: hypothetical protein VMZ04_07920 [Anaerolineae bacterium]|nr:hypothetical protein [Anaerolineae bacterium]
MIKKIKDGIPAINSHLQAKNKLVKPKYNDNDATCNGKEIVKGFWGIQSSNVTNNTSSTGIIIVVIANSLIHLDDIFFFP